MSPAAVNDLVLSFTALLTLLLAVSLAAVIRMSSWPALNPAAEQKLATLKAQFEGDLRDDAGVSARARGRKEISKKDIRAEYRERRVRKAPRALQRATRYGGITISGAGFAIALPSLPHFPPLSNGATKLLTGASFIVAAMAMVYDSSDFLRGMIERRRISKNPVGTLAEKDDQPRKAQTGPPIEPISERAEKELRRCGERLAKDVEKEARRQADENEITLEDIGEAWRNLVRPHVLAAPAVSTVRSRKASVLLSLAALVEIIAVSRHPLSHFLVGQDKTGSEPILVNRSDHSGALHPLPCTSQWFTRHSCRLETPPRPGHFNRHTSIRVYGKPCLAGPEMPGSCGHSSSYSQKSLQDSTQC